MKNRSNINNSFRMIFRIKNNSFYNSSNYYNNYNSNYYTNSSNSSNNSSSNKSYLMFSNSNSYKIQIRYYLEPYNYTNKIYKH